MSRVVPLTIKVELPARFESVPPVTLASYEDELTVVVRSTESAEPYELQAHLQFSDNGVLVIRFEEKIAEARSDGSDRR